MNGFGKRLRELREGKGWSQQDLAGRVKKLNRKDVDNMTVEIHRSTISDWERDIYRPKEKNRDQVIAMADVFKMDDQEKDDFLKLARLPCSNPQNWILRPF